MAQPLNNSKLTTLTNKTLFTTPNPFEQRFGYHRAVRRGPFIAVSGSTALKLDESGLPGYTTSNQPAAKGDDASEEERTEREFTSRVKHPDDPFLQAVVAMERCVEAVRALGGEKQDVVRARMFVANHDHCEAVGVAFKRCFGGGVDLPGAPVVVGENEDVVGAAATMIVVQNGFVDKDILVEVEVDAFCL